MLDAVIVALFSEMALLELESANTLQLVALMMPLPADPPTVRAALTEVSSASTHATPLATELEVEVTVMLGIVNLTAAEKYVLGVLLRVTVMLVKPLETDTCGVAMVPISWLPVTAVTSF
jgi:hypothetical protein